MNPDQLHYFLSQCQQVHSHLNPLNTQTIRILSSGQLLTMRTIYLNSQQATQYIDTLSQQKNLQHQNLVSIIDYYHQKMKPGSKEQDILLVFTEFSTHTLAQQIQARRAQENYFSVEELENILVSAVKALRYLQENGIGHGCLSLKDFVVTKSGQVKLMDPSIASNSPFNLDEGYYYSPELLKNNIQMLKDPDNTLQEIDFFKNDIFVLGMIMLEIGLLYPLNEIFNYTTGNILFTTLRNKYVVSFNDIYGEQLTQLLMKMLTKNSETRISSEGILEYIEQQFQSSEEENQDRNQGRAFESSLKSDIYDSYGDSSILKRRNYQMYGTVKGFLSSKGSQPSDISESMGNSQNYSYLNYIDNPIHKIRMGQSSKPLLQQKNQNQKNIKW